MKLFGWYVDESVKDVVLNAHTHTHTHASCPLSSESHNDCARRIIEWLKLAVIGVCASNEAINAHIYHRPI